MRKLVWSQPPVKHSYYKNASGEMHILGPWRLVDYWRWTREPNPYTLEPVQWLLLIWLLVRWIRVRDDRVLVAVGTHALVAVRARPPQLRMAPVVAGEADALYGGRPGIVDSTVLLLRSENQTPPARPRLSLSQRVPAR